MASMETEKLVNITSCTNDLHLMECLRDLDADDLLKFSMEAAYEHPPIIDGVTLIGNPVDLMSSGQVIKADTVLGFNKDEGSLFGANCCPGVTPEGIEEAPIKSLTLAAEYLGTFYRYAHE